MLSMRPPAMLGLFSAAVALTAVVAATLLFALPADAAITNTTFTLEIKDITKTSATLGASRSDAGGLYVQWREAGTTTWTQAQSEAAADAGTVYDSALTLTDKKKYEVEVASDSAYTTNVLTATFWTRPSDQDWLTTDNAQPWGIAADTSTVWVGDPSAEDVKAYNLTGKTRDSGKDITTMLLAESSPSPFGLYAEGSILWTTLNQATTRAFDKSGTTPIRSSTNELDDFELNGADNSNISGLWASADYFYVADTADNKIYAYDRANSNAYDSSADIRLRDGNGDPQGIWSDGTIIWVADSRDAYIYAYVLATGARYPESDIQPEHANDNPHGLWSTDGEVLWVVDPVDAKVYAYYLPPSPLFGELDGFRIEQLTKTSATVRVDIGEDSDVHFRWREAGTETWTTEETKTAQNSSTTYSLTLVDRTKYEIEAAADRDFKVSKIEDVFETRPDDQDWAIAGIGAAWGIADDGTTVWVSDTEDLDILAYNLSDMMRASGKDISETSILEGTGTTTASPYGLYSDGSHLWVVDSQASTDTLVAFDLSGAAPAYSATDTSELTALNSEASDGRGVWASSDYFYVLDELDHKIYAYDRSNSNAHDSSADITLHADNANAEGIWSNGTLMWVADSHAEKLFAYNLSDGTRDAESDIRLGHDTSQSAAGLWSPDGEVLWVVDSARDKVYAYYLPPPPDPSTPIVLVKNTGQSDNGADIFLASGFPKQAQSFMTGSNSGGYHLTSIAVRFDNISDTSGAKSELTVTLNQVSGSNPGGALCTLVTPDLTSRAANTLAAPTDGTCPVLQSGTSYFVVLNRTAHTAGTIGLQLTTSDNEDTGGADGWTIEDTTKEYSSTTSSWSTTSNSRALMIEVKGYAGTNNDATGAPTISGTPRVGEELTADTSAIMDADGLTTPNYSYQWVRVDGDTETNVGTDSSTYTLVEADAGKQIRVDVTFADDNGINEGPLSSELTDVVSSPPTGAPAITGTPRVGEELTADTSAIMDADGLTTPNYSYQWVRVVGSATTTIGTDSSTYTLTDDDAERRIRVDVTFTDDLTNAEGPLSSALSDTIVPDDVLVRNTRQTRRSSGEDFDSLTPDAIAQGFTTGANAGGYTLDSIGVHFFNTANNLSPAVNRISATLNAGSSSEPGAELCSLTNPATFGGSGLYTFAAPTTGTDPCPVLEANTTYYVSVANNSRTTSHLSATVNDAEDLGGAAGWSIGDGHTQRQGSVSSLAGRWLSNTRPLLIEVKGSAASNNFATGLPSITGTPRVGQVLTADTSAILDDDGVGTFIYRWGRVDGRDETDVGTGASTYTLAPGDEGNRIKVAVRLIDGEGNVEGPFSSVVTDTIAPSDLLVRNTGQAAASDNNDLDVSYPRAAQAFTTGAHAAGYTLSSFGLQFHNIADTATAGSELTVTLREDSSGDPAGSALCTLDDPATFSGSGLHTFTAPAANTCPRLAANTTYFIHVERANTDTDLISLDLTESNDEHSGGAAGWLLANNNQYYETSMTDWVDNATRSLVVEVKGEENDEFEVPADWSLIPTGLTGGDTFRLLFVTGTGNPTSSNIADYNSFVQAQAAAGHTDIQDYSAWFRVVGSTADTDARDNTGTTYTATDKGVRIYWLNGNKVADNYEDFYDQSWDDETDPRGADGATVTADHVWTGSTHTGEEAFAGTTSRALGTSLVRVGQLNHAVEGPLRSTGAFSTNTNYPYYALSGVFVVAVANNLPTGAPTISGTPRVGEELTADTSAIMDADGLTTPGYSYQWVRVDGESATNIGTDSSTYTLVEADAEKQIRVDVTFTDDESNTEGPLSSALTDTIAAAPPKRVTGFALDSSNIAPTGMWGNDDTFWVVNNGAGAGNKLYAYNRLDGSRDSGSDFDTLSGAGNGTPAGICSDGTTMFVADSDDDKLYAYKMSDTTHDSGKDITLDSDNGDPRGVWCDGTTVYVANDGATSGNKVFAYTISNGNRDSSKDFEELYVSTQTAAENAETPWGIWSNGTTMFVVDSADDNVFAYKHSDESQDSDKNVALITANDNPTGLWFDGRVLWVVDDTDDKLYAYNLPGANPGNTPADGAPVVRSEFTKDVYTATVTAAVSPPPPPGQSGYAVAGIFLISFGGISESGFTVEGVTYTVRAVLDANGNANSGDLILELDKALPRGFTFTADGVTYASDDATESVPGTGRYRYQWSANLSWTLGTSIQVVLSVETPKDGLEVTADVSGITDSTDGVASANFDYQWIRVDGTDETDIDGETGSTYTPTADDVDKHLKVRAVFNDDAGNQEYPITSPRFGPVVDAVAPTFESGTATSATTILLTFDEALDPDSIPAASFFQVQAGTSPLFAVDSVEVQADPRQLLLTVGTPMLAREAILLSYIKPNTNPLRDTNRNEVGAFVEGITGDFHDTFVSNLGQTASTTVADLTMADYAQRIDAGTTASFDFKEIEVVFATVPSGSATVSAVIADGVGSGSSIVATLTNPSTWSTNAVFGIPDGTTLTKGTAYYIIFEGDEGALQTTTSDNEDSGTAAGWDIENAAVTRADQTQSGFGGTWAHDASGASLQIAVRGLHHGRPGTPVLEVTGKDQGLVLVVTVPDHGSSNLTDIEYSYKETTGGTYTSFTPVTVQPGTNLNEGGTFEITGLDNGTDYTVQVQTVNNIGTSDASNEDSGTPDSPPAITSVAITSDPGTDKTYDIGDEIVVTVTFDKNITLSTGTDSVPNIIVQIGSVGFRLDCLEPTPPTMQLVCKAVIGEGDGQDSDGISIVRNALFSGNRIIVGPLGQPAVVTFDGLADDANHKVDAVRPTLTGARASDDLAKITLTFSEAIGSVDRTKITFMSGATVVTTTADSISGSEVEITLTTALTAMDTSVTVALDADAVTDAVGNGNAVLAATPVKLANQIWSATLTVKDLGSSFLGCDTQETNKGCEPSELLTDNDFSYDSVDYQIDVIDLKGGTLNLEANIAFTAASLADLTLNVGSDSFPFEDATQTAGILSWSTTGLTWSEDDMIALSIDADPPPMVVTATATTANTIVLTFDEPLDATSIPAASAFSVQSTAVLDGETTAITVASVAADADDATQLALTVGTMLYRDTITVSYTQPSDNPLRDAEENEVVSFTGQAVVNEFSDTIVSNLGQTVSVTTADLSTHDLAQRFDTGSTASFDLTEVEVLFSTAPGSSATVTAVIADGLTSTDNIVATLTNPSDWSTNAVFGIPSGTTLSHDTTYYLIIEATDGVLQTTNSNPEDSGAAANWTIGNAASIRTMVLTSGLGGTWANSPTSASLQMAVRGKHHGRPGTPTLSLGAKDGTLILEVTVPDHGSFNLTGIEYRYKDNVSSSYVNWAPVTRGTVSNEGGTFEIGGFLNGTEYTVQVQTVNDIGVSGPSNEAKATPDAPPTLTGVAILSVPGTDGAYEIGDVIHVTFTFDKDITISGTGDAPTMTLRIGTVNKKVDCEVDATTPMQLDCPYTVVEGDLDTDGINLPGSSISDPDDRIVGPLGQPAVLTHILSPSDHKVDGIRPTLTGARASNDKSKIILTFSEAIGAVDRTKMTFMSGTTAVTTTADSISGSEVEITLTTALMDSDTNVTVALDADAVSDAVGNGNAVLAATQVKLVEEIWSATLTVKDLGLGDRGCNSFQPGIADALKCSTSTTLTDNTFSYGGRNYEIEIILLETGFLNFQVDENLTAAEIRDLTLNVGSDSFPFEDASTTSFSVRWTNPGLTWNEDDMVALSIDADPPPMLATGQVATATTINLIFDQGLDSSSLPAATAFAVSVNGNASSVDSVAFNTAGDGVVLTVGTAMSAWDRVEVTYTPPSDNPLKDAAGNETEAFGEELENLLRDTLVSNLGQTSVSGVLNLSSSDASQAFTTGPTVDAYTLTGVKVKFDTVPTASATVTAFIADGQTATDNIVVNLTNPDAWSATSTFGIPSGTTLAANTTYYLIIEGSDGTLHRTASNNEDAGAVTGWSIANTSAGRGASTTGLGGTWTPQSAKAQISIEGVHKGIPGIPDLTLAAKNQAIVMEVEISEHGREDLTDIEYRYKETTGGTYTAWTSVTESFSNTGGTFEIGGLTNGTDYTVQVQGVNDSGDGLPSDEETATPDAPPEVTGVAITSSPGTDKTYAIDDDIVVTVTFDKNITFNPSGLSPDVILTIGTVGTQVTCAVGTPPTMAMTCTYTVQENDEDTDGISVPGNGIQDPDDRILGPLGQNPILTHDAIDASTDHKVDGVRPELTGARASADNAKIILTFSEAISAADRTKFTFDSGGTTLDTTGSAVIDADTKLTVTITLDTALTASDTNVTVELDADAVTDAVGNGNAALAATPIVDETAPTLSETSTPSNTEVLLTYNEPLDSTSIPAASAFSVVVNTGRITRTVSTAALSGTSGILLTLSPAFRPGDVLTVDYTVPALNPIQDIAENEAAALSIRLVDNTLPATAPDAVTSLTASNTSTFGKVDLTWDGDTWANGSAITSHEVRYAAGPIWEATLTVKDLGSNFLGCDSAETNKACTPGQLLTDNTFSYDSRSYLIETIDLIGGQLKLQATTVFSASALADLTLEVGGLSLPFADATQLLSTLTWTGTGLSWSEDDAVPLSIRSFTAWTEVPDSAPGDANATSHTLEGLVPGGEYIFQVRAVNDVGGGGEAGDALTLLAPVWEFTLRDSGSNDVTELVEGGDSATATVSFTNAAQATFDTDQDITLQWGGQEITGPPIPIRGAGGSTTITITTGQSSGSLAINSPQYDVDNYEYPYPLALTAHHGGAEIGSISLTRLDDENPPVASITMAPESVDEGEDIEVEISLNIAYFAYGTIEAAQRTVKFSHTDSGSMLSGTPPTSQLLSLNQKVVTITLPTTGNTTQNDGARTVTFTLELSSDASYTLDAQKSSVTIIVRDDDTPPLAVGNLRAQAGNTEATLRWSAPAAGTPDHGQPILHYEYRVKEGTNAFGSWTMVPNSDGTTTSHKFTGLTNGTVYTYELRAENVAGDGAVDDVSVTPRVGVPVTFGAATASVTEGGTVTVTVTLDEAPATGVTVVVPITPTRGTGLGETEYTGVPANVTFNAGDTSKSFTVTAVQDTIVETDEELTLSLGTLPTGYVTGTNSSVVITVVDNDEAEWEFTLRRGGANVTQLTEGGDTAVARVSITNGVRFETDQEINLQWGGQEVLSGLIRGLTGGPTPTLTSTITITAGQSNGTLFVGAPQGTGDLYRPPETEALTAHLGGNQIGDGIELTFVDDEAPPVLTIRLRDARVVEGGTTGLTGTLSRGYDLETVFLHALATGSTTRVPSLGLIPIDGQPNAVFSFSSTEAGYGLSPTGNTTAGDHATITFTIPSNPDYYTIGTPSTATLLILDDDAAPGAPRNISARPGDAEAALSWGRPSNYDQVWISDYQYRQRAGNGAWTAWAVIPDSDGATTRHKFTGLTNQTEYTFEVRARNSNHNGAAVEVKVTPSPRPPTTVSITASVSEPVRGPFRVTITFTDQDMDGIDTDGIEGFEADDILAFYTTRNHGSYEFRVTDFREETPGKVYSALVDKIIDGKLWIEVEEGSAQSKLDGAGNTGSYTTWQVDAPALPSAPEGETIWSDNLRIDGVDISGYFIQQSERFGELPNANFSYNGTDYEIEELIYTNTWRISELAICPALEGADSNFWLHLGEDGKAVSFGGDYISTQDFSRTKDGIQLQCTRYRWNPIELNWPKGQGRNVKITVTEGEVEERPVVASVALTSNPNNDGRPGSDSTYAIGDSVTATVTFDKAVDVTGSSQITLLFGTAEKAAACAAATNTRTMACSYEVAEGNTAPTGVGIKANTLLLDGGTIYATGSVTTRANLAHQGLGLQSGHKVDGIRPTLVTTGTDAPRTFSDGIRIQLTFSENIEEATPSLFTVRSNNVELPLGNQVSINARTVVLRLATALTDSTASLTVALDADAVEDVSGNTNLARSAVTLLNNVGVAPTGPDAPTGLTATPAPDETPQLAVTLDWTAPASDGGSAITYHQYRYSRNSGEFSSWTRIPNSSATGDNATSFTVKGLSAVNNMFTTFQFQVRAVNANANGSESSTVGTSMGLPFGPVNLEGTAGDRKVDLTWDTPANNGSAILRYEYSIFTSLGNVEIIAPRTTMPGSNADTTSFTVTGLTNGVLYDIRINAVNTVGPGGFALKQAASPATFPTAPRNLRAEAGDTQVTLRWTAPLYNGGYDVSGYEYRQKTGTAPYGSWTDITGADDTTTEHTVTGLTNGTSYSFKVRAKNLFAGEGPASNEVTAVPVTVPSAPQSLTATAGNAQAQLDWTAPASDGGNAIVSYEFRYKEGSGAFTTWATVPGSNVNTTTHTVRNLTNGTVHTFEVRATTATHKGVSAADTATPMAVKPDKPSVTVDSRPEALSLSWTVSDDGGSDIIEYGVQWKSGSGSFGTSNQQTGLTTTTTLIESLTNGTDYDVRVRARNTIGWSDWSDTVTGTPMPRPAPTVTITASVSEPATAPFRVTFTFTDQDLDGNDTDGVTGFDVHDIFPVYFTEGLDSFEFLLKDFREETPGRVYSALVDEIVDGELWVFVDQNAAQSRLDGQGNTASDATWQVDAPDPAPAPEGQTVWSDTLTVGGSGTGISGYFIEWSQSTGEDERFGELPNATFSYNGTDYEILELSYTESWRAVRLTVCSSLAGANSRFILSLGDVPLSFGSDNLSTRNFVRTKDGISQECLEYNWDQVTLDWQYGAFIPVMITR